MLDGEIVGVLVIGGGREAVAETVDVRLTVIDFVPVAQAVDVLDCAMLRVGDTLRNGVLVEKGEGVDVLLSLEVEELVVEAVVVFEELIVRVVLTLAVPVLELVTVDVVVSVYIGVTVPLGDFDILDELVDVFDGRTLTDPVDELVDVFEGLIDTLIVGDAVVLLDILPLAVVVFEPIILLEV